MTIRVKQDTNEFKTFTGHNITDWDSQQELFEYLSALKAGECGWIKIKWSYDYTSNTHFNVKEDGKPYFTNAYFSPSDCKTVIQELGQQVAKLLLGDRLI